MISNPKVSLQEQISIFLVLYMRIGHVNSEKNQSKFMEWFCQAMELVQIYNIIDGNDF